MEYVEETAISTALHPPQWRFRYVDDNHAFLKRNLVNEFHNHLNSIDPHLQFNIELEENQRLPSLDTITTRCNGKVAFNIHAGLPVFLKNKPNRH